MLSGHDHWPYLGRKQILTSSLRSRGGHLRATRASAPLQLPTGDGRDEQLRVGTAVAMLCVLSHSVVSDSVTVWTAARQAPLSMGILQTRVLDWVAIALLQGIFPTRGIESRSPTLPVDSLPTEPPWKPKNTGVGSLSLLQGAFLTQESNQGLLHCR